MNSSYKDRLLPAALFLAAILLSSPALSQEINEDTALSFGNLALASNAGVARITIEADGSYSVNSGLYVITPPTRGVYSLVGGPANALYTVNVPASVNLSGPGGAYFTLDNFVVRPQTLMTDASGNDTFYLTGRLQTQGGGMVYADGAYTGSVTLTVAF